MDYYCSEYNCDIGYILLGDIEFIDDDDVDEVVDLSSEYNSLEEQIYNIEKKYNSYTIEIAEKIYKIDDNIKKIPPTFYKLYKNLIITAKPDVWDGYNSFVEFTLSIMENKEIYKV